MWVEELTGDGDVGVEEPTGDGERCRWEDDDARETTARCVWGKATMMYMMCALVRVMRVKGRCGKNRY